MSTPPIARGIDKSSRRRVTVYKRRYETQLVPWQGELWLPSQFSAKVEFWPYEVNLEISALGGQPICRAISVRRLDRNEITTRDLRALKLPEYLAAAAAGAAVRARPSAGILAVTSIDGEEIVLSPDAVRRRGRARIDDETIRNVAKIYMEAERSPREAVMRELDIALATANRWIAQARERGYLS